MPDSFRNAFQQEQFLQIMSPTAAFTRFWEAVKPHPLGIEIVELRNALGRVLGVDVIAEIDVPSFDRSNVDGFALRAQNTVGANEVNPIYLTVGTQILTPGITPTETVETNHALAIATGGVLPRGADAVVMIEHTEWDEKSHKIAVFKPAQVGQFIAHTGSDIVNGETVLFQNQIIGAREIGILATLGKTQITVYRKPKVAIFSTGNEISPQGKALSPAKLYDSNGPLIAAAVTELGAEAIELGICPDDENALDDYFQRALNYDAIILSGGTSKGAGDFSYRVARKYAEIICHGVALKPGKPLCLAVKDQKPIAILPGFPTSAIFTFHQFVAPVLRKLAGYPQVTDPPLEVELALTLTSEMGRTEFSMVSLIGQPDGKLKAYPAGKGSGAVTSFCRADGFIQIPAHSGQLAAHSPVLVQRLSRELTAPDLVFIGSHCMGLDWLLSELRREGLIVKSLFVGSQAGLLAAQRGECDLAGIHLLDPKTDQYNHPFLKPELTLISGYQREQSFVFRQEDQRFKGKSLTDALHTALADKNCFMVNRNSGSGTRFLIDQLLQTAAIQNSPLGYGLQPRSHHAVAAAIKQKRADWGITLTAIAQCNGLGFIPVRAEHYDFICPTERQVKPSVQQFITLIRAPSTQERLAALGCAIPTR